jgi:DNA-binding NtrC family response regulator
MIRAGTFREDLFYRLNTIEIRVPPLAERADDILPLARHFLAADKKLSAAACAALRAHTWPGNVRELKNTLQRAALLATHADLTPADLGLAVVAPPAPPSEELDRPTVEAALARAGGVIAQAAAELGLSRQALYRRMEKLNIPRE